MPINNLLVQNFKGISDIKDFNIAPITLFIGPNSSGKSSCIHAMMALAQTIKIGKTNTFIVLDDENALVHLGRFIEVIHSRKYGDEIKLGVSLGTLNIKAVKKTGDKETEQISITGNSEVTYVFKSTRRTQEVYLSKATLKLDKQRIDIRRSKGLYYATYNGKEYELTHLKNFIFSLSPSALSDPNPEGITAFFLLNGIQTLLERELNNTLYLGPFRQGPARRYPFRGSCPAEVGNDGGATVAMLANEALQSKRRPHSAQIGKWLQDMGLAKSLDVSRTGSSELFDVNVRLPDETTLPLPDLGYGMSQVLPVLAQCSFAPKGATLLFEQPELHLHSGASRKLAYVFAETAKEKNARIVAETHSRELFHECIELVRKGILNPEDVIAYDVRRGDGVSSYRKIDLVKEPDGSVEVDHPWGKDL